MSQPLTFPSNTPNLGLPLLVAGQAQKEFVINEAVSILDSLAPRAVVSSLSSPPSSAQEGEGYIVEPQATDQWSGQDDSLALRIGGSWKFVTPEQGMRIFDRALGQWRYFDSGWQSMTEPAAPQGGATIDAEVRASLAALVQMLKDAGILAPMP